MDDNARTRTGDGAGGNEAGTFSAPREDTVSDIEMTINIKKAELDATRNAIIKVNDLVADIAELEKKRDHLRHNQLLSRIKPEDGSDEKEATRIWLRNVSEINRSQGMTYHCDPAWLHDVAIPNCLRNMAYVQECLEKWEKLGLVDNGRTLYGSGDDAKLHTMFGYLDGRRQALANGTLHYNEYVIITSYWPNFDWTLKEDLGAGQSTRAFYLEPPPSDVDTRFVKCAVSPLGDFAPVDLSANGVQQMLKNRVEESSAYLKRVLSEAGWSDFPELEPPAMGGGVCHAVFAAREKGRVGVNFPIYQVRKIGGAPPPAAGGAAGQEPPTINIMSVNAPALLSTTMTLGDLSARGYDHYQGAITIYEVPFAAWYNEHGTINEGTWDRVVLGKIVWYNHPSPLVPRGTVSDIYFRWNNPWMSMKLGQYRRTICSPIFTLGCLYPIKALDAHNMADDCSSNIRIGDDENGDGLRYRMMGFEQRAVRGIDSLMRFSLNNPRELFQAKKNGGMLVVVDMEAMPVKEVDGELGEEFDSEFFDSEQFDSDDECLFVNDDEHKPKANRQRASTM